MKSFQFIPLPVLLLSACSLAGSALAQPVYRCGNSYSPIACDGAVTVPAEDARSDAQRAAAQNSLARNKALADQWEHARLKEQARALAQDKAADKARSKTTAMAHAESKRLQQSAGSKKAKRRKNQPEWFTAVAKPAAPRKESRSSD